MKSRVVALWICLAILSGGCTLQPLSLEETGPELAPVLGVQPEDFRFVSHAGFRQIPELQTHEFKLKKGIVALTDTDIWLLPGRSVASAHANPIKIPISEINGVSQLPSQVQLRRSDNLIVMRMYSMFSKLRYELDELGSGEFRDLLERAGIPRFEATNTYGFDRPFETFEDRNWPGWNDGHLRTPIYSEYSPPSSFYSNYSSQSSFSGGESADNDSGTQGGHAGGGTAAHP